MSNRIEICGAIASGKTSLAKSFTKLNYNVVFEDFSKISMLNDFYSDTASFAFETEVSFTLQHYFQIKKASITDELLVADFSSVDDYAFAAITLNDKELQIYKQIFSYTQEKIGKPKKLIRLSASSDELLVRIKSRGRDNEQTIEKEYLLRFEKCLSEAIDQFYADIPIIRIDTEKHSQTEYTIEFLEKVST
jgi:Deoxynucleoside kinases